MNFRKIYSELKRRNVFKVAVAYTIAGWLAIQVISTISPQLGFPEWIAPLITVLVLIGFPIVLIIAWAFELTPEGVKKSDEVEFAESMAPKTGKKINAIIIASLSLLIIFLLVERFFIADFSPTQPQAEASIEISNQSVAVLPFADLSENGDQEWFSDGLTEEILNSLAQLPELKVISRTSAFQFKGKDQDISKIADTLGVANVVEGSVRRIGDQLRVTAQLIRAKDGFHLWSETYDSSTENLFEVQTSIAEEIATTLDVFLDEEKRELMFAAGTRNPEAFQEYLKGLEVYRQAHKNFMTQRIWTANEYFDRALELDSGFGEASLYKMDAYAHLLVDAFPSPQDLALEEARVNLVNTLKYGARHVEKPDLRIATEMNTVFFSDSWYQLIGLKEKFKKALGENSLFPTGSIWTTEILMLLGEENMVDEHTEIDIKLDPLNGTTWMYRSSYIFATEGLEAAREVIKESRNSYGQSLLIDKFEHVLIGIAGEKKMLKSIYTDGITGLEFRNPYILQMNAYLAAVIGNKQLANKLIEEYRSKVAFMDEMIAMTYYELGRSKEAKALIKKLDSNPAGPTNLALTIIQYGNRLFFDLENAPNTAARFREADIDVSRFTKMPWLK